MSTPNQPVLNTQTLNSQNQALMADIRLAAQKLGFAKVGVSSIDLSIAEQRLLNWLAKGFHGEMGYMQRHGTCRSRPAELEAGTASVISVSMNYLPQTQNDALALLDEADQAYVSRYALGRDYHKLIRKRLKQLAIAIQALSKPFSYRVFTDSAPILEKPIAAQAGIGWVGKHSNVLNREHGSWFFLGEIYIDTELPTSEAVSDHCGSCQACIDACPTDAIVAPYIVDARKCISYLTIENHGIIPEDYRAAMGNRIYGCDDCQLVCPWNRFAPQTDEVDFRPRHSLDDITLLALFNWTEAEFLERFQGSAIRRIGYQSWQRNIAVALGNALAIASKEPRNEKNKYIIINALKDKLDTASDLVGSHIKWALAQQIIH